MYTMLNIQSPLIQLFNCIHSLAFSIAHVAFYLQEDPMVGFPKIMV
jgi:hypothetical protein